MCNHLASLSGENRDIECMTRGQSSSGKWHQDRAKRISSSYFKEVVHRRSTTLTSSPVKRIIYGHSVTTFALQYGTANEAEAINKYEEKNKVKVQRWTVCRSIQSLSLHFTGWFNGNRRSRRNEMPLLS